MEEQRILVVESHRAILMGIGDILQAEGYTVFTAADGAQALQMMEEQIHPDLIISDIAMPCIDGYALCKAVRARPEWMFIPFMLLTANSGKEGRMKAKDFGADGYIVKPFTPQELVRAVQACISLWGPAPALVQ